MAIPTQGIKMDELTQETAATLDGTEEIVMFDTTEGKRSTLDDVKTFILNGITFTYSNGRLTITKGGAE